MLFFLNITGLLSKIKSSSGARYFGLVYKLLASCRFSSASYLESIKRLTSWGDLFYVMGQVVSVRVLTGASGLGMSCPDSVFL